ncbi:MAG TPA: RpiB/LacA/LacB family sugar-phosphate isomerase [Spirochaetia bacterium]|nr:RpiB/LacA/LacB family sugar-phosphate isomerase [Spirochaetia bacterium]
MHVIIGADHGGFKTKEEAKAWLMADGYEVVDVGARELVEDDDFVDYAKAAIKEAITNDDKVILFCRNGFGMMIAANKFVGVRCGLAFDDEAVRRGRTDDNINCLSVPADYIDNVSVERMIKIFLTENFNGGENYKRRVMKLDNLIQ